MSPWCSMDSKNTILLTSHLGNYNRLNYMILLTVIGLGCRLRVVIPDDVVLFPALSLSPSPHVFTVLLTRWFWSAINKAHSICKIDKELQGPTLLFKDMLLKNLCCCACYKQRFHMNSLSYTYKVIFHSRDSVMETVQFFGPDSLFKLFKGYTFSFQIQF